VLPDTPQKKAAVITAPKSVFAADITIDQNETVEQKISKRAKAAISLTDKLCSINYASAEVKVLSSIDDVLVNLTNENPAVALKRQMQLVLAIITSANGASGVTGWFKRVVTDQTENMKDLVAKVNVTCDAAEQCLTVMSNFVTKLDTVMNDTNEAHIALRVYIDVGDKELKEKGTLIKKLLQSDLVSTDVFKLQEAQDKCKAIDNFEKRITYLRQIVQMSQMSMQQIKLMQDTTVRLMSNARSILEQTVPQWKKQFITVYVSNAAKGLRTVADSEKLVLQSMEDQLKAEIQQVIS
jgi:hypothetical protein